MPIEVIYITKKGKRLKRYRWGKHGKPYARLSDAEKQGRAIEMSKHNPTKMRRNK